MVVVTIHVVAVVAGRRLTTTDSAVVSMVVMLIYRGITERVSVTFRISRAMPRAVVIRIFEIDPVLRLLRRERSPRDERREDKKTQ